MLGAQVVYRKSIPRPPGKSASSTPIPSGLHVERKERRRVVLEDIDGLSDDKVQGITAVLESNEDPRFDKHDML
jgi:hypothetical protein